MRALLGAELSTLRRTTTSYYYDFESTGPVLRRMGGRLLDLRQKLTREVPPKNLHESLLLATWNIREFDSTKGGRRTEESFAYIAEIASRFDLLALQEVRENLSALEHLQGMLGPWWAYIVTDVTEGQPGNRERTAFLFDKRKVRFAGIAGEAVIPPKAVRTTRADGKNTTIYEPSKQLSRTPFLAGFQVGWFKFMLCTVHIAYGRAKASPPNRVEEVKLIAEFLSRRADESGSWSNNMILLGDFNIFHSSSETMQAILDAGFQVPQALQEVPASNVGKKKRRYDQIAFKVRDDQLTPTGQAGVFDFFQTVYLAEDEDIYADSMGPRYHTTTAGVVKTRQEQSRYYLSNWRTHQMSDHLPMWVELKIDFGAEYLSKLANSVSKLAE